MAQKGYKANEAYPVDMFPMTEHCEVVVKLAKTKGIK